VIPIRFVLIIAVNVLLIINGVKTMLNAFLINVIQTATAGIAETSIVSVERILVSAQSIIKKRIGRKDANILIMI
jgi:hypothetical protein